MGARNVGLLAALGIAGAILGLVMLWPKRAETVAAVPHKDPGSRNLDPGWVANPPEETVEDPPTGTIRHALEQATEVPLGPEQVILPEDGTVQAVMRILDDPAFQVACAQPSEADSEVLSYLIAEARKVYTSFKASEVGRRMEAGLGERLKDYRPGEPFATQSPKRGAECVSYRFSGNDAYRIVFSFDDYPYMYALRDQIFLLEGESKSRER